MNDRPGGARPLRADLEAVEAEFPDPPDAHEPLGVPAHVVARWQSAIRREAERRAPDPPDDAGPHGSSGGG